MAVQHIQSFDGTRIAVDVEGSETAPAVVFSHHMGGSMAGWESQVHALRDKFRVVRYDTRGHGASAAPPAPYSIDMLGQDALAVMRGVGIAQAHFVGLSQGGMTGMWLATRCPQMLNRLVLANTTPFIPNKLIWDELVARARAEGLRNIARQTILDWLSSTIKNNHPAKVVTLIDQMAGMPIEGYAGACAVLRDVDLRAELSTISAKTLVIGGAEDGPRKPGATLLASSIPDASLVMIPDAAHLSHVENPAVFNAIVLEHFR